MNVRIVGEISLDSVAAKAIKILLVEDDPASAGLTRAALRDANIIQDVHLVKDGEQALQFLKKAGDYADAPRPDLILLDLNLPKLDGRELLGIIKADGQLKDIPVVVLTSSSNPNDVAEAYRCQVAFYITKPFDPDQYFHAIRTMKELWLNVATLPRFAFEAGAR